MFRRVLAVILILTLLVPAEAFAAKKKRRVRTAYPTAVSAIVLDGVSNQILFAKNIDRRIFPASTTKVMTVLLALERLPLDQYVTVGQAPTWVQPTKLDLRPGEQYTVRDLIYAALLKSANDAAVVLAEAMGGSQGQFVGMMNARARKAGAMNTQFANAHGLPSQGAQYSTARDMALIYKEALKNSFFREAITLKYRVIYSKGGRRHFLKSHNKALFAGWKRNVYGKTGYTRQAQSCFVGGYTKGSGTQVVAVFGCRKRWQDIKFLIERYGGTDL